MTTKPNAHAPCTAPDGDGVPGDMSERVIRAANVAYYEWLPASDELHVSPALLDLFGYGPGPWTQKQSWEAIHEEDRASYRAARIAYLKGDADRAAFTYRARIAGGNYRWLRDQTSVERDAAGRVTRLVGVVSDITEARQREIDLQAANQALVARQAASIEVLKAISASPDDPQPVFELIARRGRELCNAAQASVTEYDGVLLHMRARDGYDLTTAQLGDLSWPQAPNPDTVHGRVALSGAMVHIRDLADDGSHAGGSHHVMMRRRLGSRSLLGVPLLRDGRVVGTIAFGRAETGGFDAAEIALVEAFAEQAVIAIASATTLGELRARTEELARRNSECGERIEQQSATIDVLKVMSASPGATRPVFELIVERARAFCEADHAMVALLDGEMLHLQAHTGMTASDARDYEARFPRPLGPSTMFGRAILARDAVQTPDVSADPEHFSGVGGARAVAHSIISVPLMRAGTPIGAIAIGRGIQGEFSATQVELLRTFAEQAVIAVGSAETYRELQARTAELAKRNSEYGKRIEQQSATIDVLKVMSGSPGDAQPVFELIARRALEFCGATGARLIEFDGQLQHLRALVRADELETEADKALRQMYPTPPDHDSVTGRVILQRAIVHTRDEAETPSGLSGRYAGSVVGVPLLRDDRAAGAIVLSRSQTGGFNETQIELLQTFAEQAVIAISSAETYRELQARTAALAARNSEYGERIEQQSATIDVLKLMSASPGDARPIFELIVERAIAFCEADGAGVALLEGEMLRLQAYVNHPNPTAYESSFPQPVSDATMFGRAILARDAVQMADSDEDEGYGLRTALGGESRSMLGVPLFRAGTPIGAISIVRRRLGAFSATHVELLKTFAEQAVIAIGSAETYRELQARTAALAERNSEYGERIEQQSATIDVLKAMSASPGDTQPVFDLITRRARELCNGVVVGLTEYDGEQIHVRSTSAIIDPAAHAAFLAQFPMRPTSASIACRAILEKRIIHIRDADAEPGLFQAIRDNGTKSILALPLLRDGAVIGSIALNAMEPGGFSDSQVALLQTFAEQAVIAIGSAETYRELQARTAALAERNSEYGERIEHQSATIDVLKEMSASPGDAQPVLQLIARRARELCDAETTGIFSFDGEMISLRCVDSVDMHSLEPYISTFPRAPARDYTIGRAVLDRQAVEIDDADADLNLAPVVHAHRNRSIITLPFLVDDGVVGGISIAVRKPGGLTESQKALARTLAEQASLAIGAAAVHRQLQERTAALAERNSEYGERIEHQSATIDVLKAMSASPDDTQPIFDLITRRAQQLCNGATVGLFEFDGKLVYARASSGGDQAVLAALQGMFPMAPTRGSLACRAILDRQIVHIPDMNAEPGLLPAVRNPGAKSTLSLPLLRDGRAIGAMSLNSSDVGGFSDNQIELLKTFAEQAVIAVGSAETFRELRERTAALSRSVAELQALEEVLRAVNSSLDLETVLATIISRAVQLSQADEGTIYEFDETEEVFVPKAAFGMTAERVEWLRERRVRLGETHLGRSAVLRAPVHIDDVQEDLTIADAGGLLRGIHAVLAVPLLRQDKVVGGLVIRRRIAGGFAPTIPTLLQTFAGQSVLAIENARLFQDARRARTVAEAALVDLRRAQDRLVQSEKMASLGQLTAGIAHEIKNPLNFVNNFADLSVDLLDELHDAVAPNRLTIADDLRAEIDDLTATLKGNLEKITQHGRRADSIVKNMLLHSRAGPSEYRAIDLNSTVEEALNLAYHGARAEAPGFNITLEKDLDPAAGSVDLYPQEFIRVMLNLIGNGFYAARNRADQSADTGFEPTLRLTTRDLGEQVEIRVRDNGTGISDAVRDKIFEPFFTTKPAGEGTGLGLSLSYDIVVKQHGGQLNVDSQTDEFTEFVITLPRGMPASDGGRA